MVQDRRLTLDWTRAHDVFPLEKGLSDRWQQTVSAKRALAQGTGLGGDMTAWIHSLKNQDAEEIELISQTAEQISEFSDVVVVVGIGGSHMGAKAVYDALSHSYALSLNPRQQRRPLLLWAGCHLSTDEWVELLDILEGYSPSIVVISKSGTTTEVQLGFRILKSYLEERFGESETQHRIFVVTDSQEGSLCQIAKKKEYTTFHLPRGIGGRYSVFSNVGLLPLAIAGIDIRALLEGAKQASLDCLSENNESFETNLALTYATLRTLLYEEGYKVEALCHWTPKLSSLAEWWKQLFGESDGKNNTGIYPSSAFFTRDLHSLGQYFQEGERLLFATHIKILDENSLSRGSIKRRLKIPSAGLQDDFFFLAEKELSSIQTEAQNGTFLAHADGKLPTLVWELPELSPWWLGYWCYTNLFACALGGYLRGINPFDQPGVEQYKINMLALLGEPRLSDKQRNIRSRLERGQRLRTLSLTSFGNS